jgi:hypothetical protein
MKFRLKYIADDGIMIDYFILWSIMMLKRFQFKPFFISCLKATAMDDAKAILDQIFLWGA